MTIIYIIRLRFATNEVVNQRAKRKLYFAASQVSLKLIMFHVYFLKHFAPRKGKRSLKQIADEYDRRYGFAPDELKEEFQKEVFNILKIDNYGYITIFVYFT